MQTNTTSLIVTGVGVTVTALGATMLKGATSYAVMGFGAAHILLGILDMFRPTIKH